MSDRHDTPATTAAFPARNGWPRPGPWPRPCPISSATDRTVVIKYGGHAMGDEAGASCSPPTSCCSSWSASTRSWSTAAGRRSAPCWSRLGIKSHLRRWPAGHRRGDHGGGRDGPLRRRSTRRSSAGSTPRAATCASGLSGKDGRLITASKLRAPSRIPTATSSRSSTSASSASPSRSTRRSSRPSTSPDDHPGDRADRRRRRRRDLQHQRRHRGRRASPARSAPSACCC